MKKEMTRSKPQLSAIKEPNLTKAQNLKISADGEVLFNFAIFKF